MKSGAKFTPEQLERLSESHMGQVAWNKGHRGCKRGHDPELYVCPPSGVWVCLGCKRENGAAYRKKHKAKVQLRGRLARYGISESEFSELWRKQAGCCAICGITLDGGKYRIDHDHATGRVRGLLCVSCNTGIGLLRDSAEVLMSAAKYLSENHA